jgi:hypothetical protein
MSAPGAVVDAHRLEDLGSAAVVHDYLNQGGRAERAVLELGGDVATGADLHVPLQARVNVPGNWRPRRTDELPRPDAGRCRVSRALPSVPGGLPVAGDHGRRSRRLELEWLGPRRAHERLPFHAVYCYTPHGGCMERATWALGSRSVCYATFARVLRFERAPRPVAFKCECASGWSSGPNEAAQLPTIGHAEENGRSH